LVSLATRSAQPLSATEECALKPKDAFSECDKCPEMVVVPAGAFRMGSPADEKGRGGDEGPLHEVTFKSPFAVGKLEVTVDEFAAFVAETNYVAGTCAALPAEGCASSGAFRVTLPASCDVFNGSKYDERADRSWRNPGFPQTGSHPVVCLNWYDAKAYVAWLSKKTNHEYRLLSEAEWEYAARARQPGTATSYPRYSFGDDEAAMCRNGNAADQAAKRAIFGPNRGTVFPCDDGHAHTAPAGSYPPNAFGLHDMHGNAWEWVEDCYEDSYELASPLGLPRQTASQDVARAGTGPLICGRRVLRGGSWVDAPVAVRAAYRHWSAPGDKTDGYGFRVARSLNWP
jgi:formylglycine-generating enzyme required for sulfatase activity